MRRTYRSKKETGGVLDRRDLLLNLDEKSSAYDAFFIENIKQTKRELSCIGHSNAHGIASNRVRKRKYVKRVVQRPETPCRDSLSRSAYLTPDKSIRVNKPLDPFDMLLNSSPACKIEVSQPKAESVTSKVDLFDAVAQKKEGKTYTRKKPVRAKKVNYESSCSSDSDKENSDEHANITRNTSDIKSYQLLIENVANTTPKSVNDSINNIVNNLSLLNKLKNKNSFNESMKKPLSYYKNRLTRNIQSPVLQKSPLCSTPFKVKYRGDSIFKFSPISVVNEDNSPRYTTTTDDRNDSIVFLTNNNKNNHKDSKENAPILAGNTECGTSIKEVHSEKGPDNEVVIHQKERKEESVLVGKSNATSSVEISSCQTTEVEPFLGFSNNSKKEKSIIDKTIQRTSYVNRKVPRTDVDVTQIEAYDNYVDIENCSQYDVSNETNNVTVDNTSLESENNDKDSLYDTCNSDQISIEEIQFLKEPVVQMQRMNDSLFLKYYEKINNSSSGTDETDETDEILDHETDIHNETEPKESNKNNSSLEDEDLSHKDVDETDESLDQETDIHHETEPKESNKNNSSLEDEDLFHKDENFSIENDLMTQKNELISQEHELSYEISVLSQEDGFASFGDMTTVSNEQTSDNDLDIEEDIDNELLENEASNYNDSILSNDDVESNEEDKCISFVTTRRRNEVTNNSIMSIFNDSYASSSTDCDKTVLSNNVIPDKCDLDEYKIEIIGENDTLTDCHVDKQANNYVEELRLSKDVEHPKALASTSSNFQEKEDNRVSLTARNSNITDRKSSIRARASSIQLKRNTISAPKPAKLPRESMQHSPEVSRQTYFEKPAIVLQPGKKWERSLSIYRRMTLMTDHFDESILEDESIEKKGRKYRQSVISTMEMQEYNGSLHNESINSRRSTFVSKPSRSTLRIVKDPDISRLSVCNTTVFDDLKGFLNEECDDTIIELSKLSIADQTHEVTVLNTFHDTSSRLATPRDFVLRRCGQTEAIQFDECYPDTVLKNCHKIGEGVYGEVFLWRDRDGRARVLKIVPIAGTLKVNGECQKDFHEIISEIVIAMELSALRAPIAEINRHFDEGKDVEALDLHAIENATDVFNEVLAVRCVYGNYPARLLDLWDLYDECKGSENDNPAVLPRDQQFIVLELANAGQDLESYQFNSAEQAYALFLQVAYGLAVAEEAFQFEHRDLHWGNVLIAPTEQKFATFVLRGRSHRVPRRGVAATIIDYSLSRVSLPLAGGECAALYNDLGADDSLFDAVGDYQFEVYRLMRDKLGNDWKNFEPYTNILWLHYTVDKMITALRYKRTNTKIHKHYIEKLKGIKSRILEYGSAALFVLTDNEI